MKKDKEVIEAGSEPPKLVEGEDYYFEGGLMVLTSKFLLERGFCCGSGCRHCPYPTEDPHV
jgi:hypothetical protein